MGQFEEFIGVNFWTALFVLLNTLAIFFVARKYLFEPVHKMIQNRQNEIDGLYASASKAKNDAEELEKSYQEKLAEAQSTSDRLIKEAVDRAQKREEEIVEKANKEASAIREKAEADIEREKKKALNDAKNEISSLAVAIAEKVVAREISEQDQVKLVDHFIDELGDLK